jgi:amino acid permease
MIYNELENKDLKTMWKVMLFGTIGATFAYFLAGVFGYVAFAMRDDVRAQMNK